MEPNRKKLLTSNVRSHFEGVILTKTFLLQPYPMYHVTTNWQQVVPKLNSRGRDLLLVCILNNLSLVERTHSCYL